MHGRDLPGLRDREAVQRRLQQHAVRGRDVRGRDRRGEALPAGGPGRRRCVWRRVRRVVPVRDGVGVPGGNVRPGVPAGLRLPGADLLNGDILICAANSSVGVTFLDGTRVSLGPNSEMQLNNYRFVPLNKDYAFDIYMKKGSAVYSSGKLGKLAPEAVKFNTPQATVGVRGTKFLVKVN